MTTELKSNNILVAIQSVNLLRRITQDFNNICIIELREIIEKIMKLQHIGETYINLDDSL